MSTRGFVGFVINGAEKIAYNHCDSYPAGLGIDTLTWLRGVDPEVLEGQARALRVVDPDSVPTDDDQRQLAEWADTSVGEQSLDDWYCLLHKTQGNPALILRAGVIEDAGAFPCNSLFAEWGYLVDLDRGVFEVYEGVQQSPHDRGRFAGRPSACDGYAPVALAASWPLAELPDDKTFAAVDKTFAAVDKAFAAVDKADDK